MVPETAKKTNNVNNEKQGMNNLSIEDKMNNFQLYVDDVKVTNESVIIRGFVESPFSKDELSISVANPLKNCESICEVSVNDKNDDYILSEAFHQYFFETEIPVSDKLLFEFMINIVEYPDKTFQPEIFFTPNSLINDNFDKITKCNYVLSFNDNQFYINEKEYLFSIIIPSFNFSSLDNQLNTIFNQEINTDNFQVIIVNNEYNNYSDSIALKYKKQYPNNIFFIKSSEFELNNLIDTGLNYATGNYVRILDVDEELSDFELKQAQKLLKHNDAEKIISFRLEESLCYKEDEDVCSHRLDKKIIFSDKEYLELVLRENFSKNIGQFLQNQAAGNIEYAKTDLIKQSDDLVKNISLCDEDERCRLEDYVIDKTEEIINQVNDEGLSVEEQEKLRENFRKLYENFGEKSFYDKFSDKKNEGLLHLIACEKFDIRKSFDDEIILKTGDYTIDNLSKRKITIKRMHINRDNLYLSCEYNYSLLDDVEIKLIKQVDAEKSVIPCKTTSDVSKSFLSYDIEKTKEFEVTVPLKRDKNIELYFEIVLNNDLKICASIDYEDSNIGENKYYISDYYYISKEEECLNISRGYAFSVVIAIYNTENYLEQTLDSVINQTIGFEDNVQLILVNDGSPDNSKDICLEYVEKYPNNIVYLEQENSGQATARNNGLKYVKGDYVNFLDSDDYIEENALEKVYTFFKSHEKEVDIVAMPIKFFGRRDNYHMLNDKFKKEGIIDLEKEPNNPQLSSSSAFIKNYLFEEFAFPTNVISSEDTIILNKILLRRKKYGVVNDTTYYYRKRFDESSTIDSVSKQKEFFTDKLKYYFLELINYSLEMEKEVLPFIQYLIAYDIQWMLKEPDISILNEEEKKEFFKDLRNVMKYVDTKCILNNKFVTNNIFKSFFMKVKNDDKHIELNNNHVILKSFDYEVDQLEKHRIWLDIVEIEDNTLKISGFLNSIFDIDEISILAEKESEGSVSYYKGKYVKYTSRENIMFLSENWQYKYNFDIQVPLNVGQKSNIKLVTRYYKDGNNSNDKDYNVISCILPINFTKHVKISGISNYIVKDDYILFFESNSFKIEKYSYNLMKKYEKHVQKKIAKFKKHNYREALKIRSKYLKLYPLIRLYKRHHQIHIYMDRLDVADDNSEHLFRYASKQHDFVKKYYVLSKDSPDFKRVSSYGNVVEYKSEKNKLLYLMADKVISTHPYESGINPFFSYNHQEDERENYSGLINSKIYFLQHGVTKDNISDWMSKYDKNLSLLVTVSDLERKSFDVEGYGYDYDIIQTLGFPRYDNLKNNPGKQILIIPTWRKYLRGNKNLFLNSDYFKSLNGLLNNEEFIRSAKDKGYKIVFKAHPELEKNINDTDELYIDLFDIDENVKLSTQESYQELFNNSSLLITDYSSVFFDFAYQKKPVIYYHPADDYHYQEGYFDYESMGFGEIIDNEESLVKTINTYMQNDCKMKNKYSDRVDSFFKYTDKNNSKRVYEWIKNH